MKVKICGITNPEDAEICSSLGADALGFIFYEKSKRNISYSDAGRIISGLSPFIVKVGVFIEQSADEINLISQKIGLNAVQLHGDADQSFMDGIELPVIKSFRINDDFDFSILDKYSNCKIMLDAFSNEALGGTGTSFKWNLIPPELRERIIIAGGVSSSNIEALYREIKPGGVDLSSSVESVPGKKDAAKLKDFFNKINKLRYSTC